MYTLIFERNFVEHIIAKHLCDIEHCEEAMVYYCLDNNKEITMKRTWIDNRGRLVYDLGLDDILFLCAEEK